MLYFNIFLLGISAISALVKPSYIQHMAKYKNQEVLIVDWGIYALSLVILMVSNNLEKSLLFCYISSIIWNYKMYKKGEINVDPNSSFYKIAVLGNSIGIIEILYYLNFKPTLKKILKIFLILKI